MSFADITKDTLEEECAVFGVFAPGMDVARMTCFGLQALQHRGQESAGIAVGDGSRIVAYKDLGLVTQVFGESNLSALEGFVSVGHVRYSTSGSKGSWQAAQPHISAIDETQIALAHNGTLTNVEALEALLRENGVQTQAGTDSEIAAKAIGVVTRQTHHLRDGISYVMKHMEGAYAMVLANPEALYAFRDPCAIRPLCIGQLQGDKGWVVSSESCGLDIVGAKYVRDVKPGEIVRFNKCGVVSTQAVPTNKRASCIFEYVYFARPDSVIDGQNVYEARFNMGKQLATEAGVDADIVMGVPDSGIPSALGFAQKSGIAYAEGIVKNRYVGRTFISPTNEMRQLGIRLKLNPLPSVISGKRIVVIDDSVVRGNTSKKLVAMLKSAGATQVHLRIVSPEVIAPCFYGIDTSTKDQLIAANKTLTEMCEWMGATSLAFLSLEGLRKSLPNVWHSGFCDACFSGEYPL